MCLCSFTIVLCLSRGGCDIAALQVHLTNEQSAWDITLLYPTDNQIYVFELRGFLQRRASTNGNVASVLPPCVTEYDSISIHQNKCQCGIWLSNPVSPHIMSHVRQNMSAPGGLYFPGDYRWHLLCPCPSCVQVWVSSVTEIRPGDLRAQDMDTPPAELHFMVTPPSNGHLALKSAPMKAVLNFTQEHIDQGQLLFVHKGKLCFSITYWSSDTAQQRRSQKRLVLNHKIQKLYALEKHTAKGKRAVQEISPNYKL